MKQKITIPEVTIQELVEREPEAYKDRLEGFQEQIYQDREELAPKITIPEVTIQELVEREPEAYKDRLEGFQEQVYQDRERQEGKIDKFFYSLNRKYKPKKGLSKLLVAGGMALGMGLSGCATTTNFYIEPRLGVVFPVSAEGKTEQAYDPSVTIGVAGGIHLEEIGFGAEVDAHAFGSSKEYKEPVKATVRSGSIILGTSASFYPLNLILDQIPKLNPELVVGIDALGEFTTIDIPDFDVHEEISSLMFGLKFGIGATLFDRIHAELSYTVLPASENVPGFFHFLAGYRFFFGEPIWSTE